MGTVRALIATDQGSAFDKVRDEVRDKVTREVEVTFSILIMIVLTAKGFGSLQVYSELSGANLVPNLVDWLQLCCSRSSVANVISPAHCITLVAVSLLQTTIRQNLVF